MKQTRIDALRRLVDESSVGLSRCNQDDWIPFRLERERRIPPPLPYGEQTEWESAIWWFQILLLCWSVPLGCVYRLK